MSRSKGSLATEFVLITLGVGLALAADSAVERYRDRALARDALVAVQRDIRADIEELVGRIEGIDSMFVARQRLGAVVAGTAVIRDSVQFMDDLARVAEYLTFDARTAAFDALTSSGRLDLVANEDLREGLLDYVNFVENVAEADIVRRQAILSYSERLIPRLVRGDSWRGRPGTASELERRAWASGVLEVTAIRESDALRELLLLTESPRGWQSLFYRGLLEDAQILLDLLDDELGVS